MNMNEQDNLILAIESSCDETAASVIKNGRSILSMWSIPKSGCTCPMAVWCRDRQPVAH